MAVAWTRAAAWLVLAAAACGRNVKTIPPTIEGISLLGDTLWSVPVPILGGRERVTRLQDARERLVRNPGDFLTAYDVARYTADLGRFSQAIEKFGDASALGGLDPRPYARRGELYLLLRRIDRASSDLRTADRLNTGEAYGEQQVMAWGEMIPRNFASSVPTLLGITSLVRGEDARAVEHFQEGAANVESLREAIQATLWFRASQPGTEFPSTLPRRFQGAVRSMLANATRGTSGNGCAAVTGNLVDGDLVCFVHGSRLLAEGRRGEAVSAFDLIRSRSHWASAPHLAAEAAIARLVGDEASGSENRKAGRRGSN